MNDLINGRELLKSLQVDLCSGIACKDCSMSTERGDCRVEKWIDTFPSADRPEGRWIVHFDDIWPEESTIECSVCHEEQPLEIDDNFCPNCGEKMERSK